MDIEKNSKPVSTSSSAGKQNIIALISLFSAVIACVGAAGALYFSHQSIQTLLHEQQILRDTATDFETRQAAATAELASLQSKASTQDAFNQSVETKLDKLTRSVDGFVGTDVNQRTSWILRDAEYQMQLAQLNLHFQRAPGAAIALLEYVDAQLKSLDDPKLLSLRESLQHAITDLRAVPAVDLAGLLSQCTALSMQLKKLPILSVTIDPKSVQPSTDATVPDEQAPLWRRIFTKIGSELKSVVSIRRLDQPIKPLLSEASFTLLSQTLDYAIQQMKWAIIYGDTTVYQASIQQIITLLQSNYKIDVHETQMVLDQLDALAKVDIHPTMPDISSLLSQVQLLIHSRSAVENRS